MNIHYLLASSAILVILTSMNANAELPNGIASGDITQSSAILWTRSDTTGQVSFEYSKDKNFSNILGDIITNVIEPLQPVKVAIDKLNAGTRYYYRATDNTGTSLTGSFSTLENPGSKTGLRFGVSGDWRGELAPYPALANAASRNLDFFAVLGDTIYADYSSPALPQDQATSLNDFRIKQNEVYSTHHGMNTLADLRASTAIFATIDDHEVTNDFSGAADTSTDTRFSDDPAGTLINDSLLYNNGIQAFLEFNPIASETYTNTGSDLRMDGEIKLYRQRSIGSSAIFISLDTRSFRDPGLPEVIDPLDQAEIDNYLATSLTADRTLLGERQLTDLKTDLLQAQTSGVIWKFVTVPEPVQNLGVVGASDRFEGYAKERTEILKFINDKGIENVVFITADIHGTLINNLDYQELTATGIKHTPTSAFEISTGSVAFDKPFGPTVLEALADISASGGFFSLIDIFLLTVGVVDLTAFEALPVAIKDSALKVLVDQQLISLGYSPIGLEDSGLDATLLQGDYNALHTFGWTEFEIDANTQNLLVTTYGIEAYSEADIENNLENVLTREPRIINQFEVKPVNTVITQCANFINSQVTIPCVKVANDQYSAQLSVTQASPLQFSIANAQLLDQPLKGCATFDQQTGSVELPCVQVGEQQFWANLKLVQNQAPIFELDSFGLKDAH